MTNKVHPATRHKLTSTADSSQSEAVFRDNAALIAAEFPVLARYLGESRFSLLAREFSLGVPLSQLGSESWRMKLPPYLARSGRFKKNPEIAELTQLELSFQIALAVDAGTPLPLSALTNCSGNRQAIALHASAQSLVLHQNTTSIWSAIRCGELPPRPYRLDDEQHVLVWQQKGLARFRLLGGDEAQALRNFNQKPPQGSPYFRGWVEAGLVVEAAK